MPGKPPRGSDRSRRDRIPFGCASFYRAEGSAPRRRLARDGFQGRSGSPCAVFEESDEIVGKAVFDMLDWHQTVFVRDDEPGPDGASLGKSYRTYIASTVAVGDDLIGMLCVDAPTPGDLIEVHDIPVMRMLAGFLGVAFKA